MRQLDKASILLRYVYLLESDGLYKIGFSRNPNTRRKRLQTGSPKAIHLIHTIRTWHYRNVEEMLHRRFSDKRLRGEWFALSDDDVAYFKTLNSFGKTPEEEAERTASDAAYHASAEYAQKQRELHDWLENGGYPPWDKPRAATTALQTT